jgi:hypothetical protein
MYNDLRMDVVGVVAKLGFFTFYLLWIALTNLSAVETFMAERATLVAERYSGAYGGAAFLATKAVLDFALLRVVPVVVAACVFYFPIGLRAEAGAFWGFLGVTALFSLATACLSAAIANVAPSFGVAVLVNGFLIILYFAFGGFVAQADAMPPAIAWLRYLSPFGYAFEALAVNELRERICEFTPRDPSGRKTGLTIQLSCHQYLYNLSMRPERYALDVTLLAAWFVAFALLCVLAVATVSHGRR